MPALVLGTGETLIESAAILDYHDELVGPGRALLPQADEQRRRALRILVSATAACDDMAIAINYERRKPASLRPGSRAAERGSTRRVASWRRSSFHFPAITD